MTVEQPKAVLEPYCAFCSTCLVNVPEYLCLTHTTREEFPLRIPKWRTRQFAIQVCSTRDRNHRSPVYRRTRMFWRIVRVMGRRENSNLQN
jgi:hypothetical protein